MSKAYSMHVRRNAKNIVRLLAKTNAFRRTVCGCLHSLLLFDATAADVDYRLESRIGSPGSPVQRTFVLEHNSPEMVMAEVNDPAIRKALAVVAGFKDLQKIQDVQLTVSSERWRESSNSLPAFSFFADYRLKYPSLEAKKLFPDRLQQEIKNYLQTRLVGHTREYAVASLARARRASVATERARAGLLNLYKEIPESWLKPWEERGRQVGYYLVDGDLAWTFRLVGPVMREVADAQEFDPRLRDTFAAARKKAEDNLAARGVVRRIGYVHVYWAELKKVLREDHKIQWRCPSDLNLALYD